MREERDYSVDAFWTRAIKDNIPLSVLFELTYRCNLRCRHCYVVDQGEQELCFDEIIDILDQLAAEKCLFLTFSGGEVLLREDFFDIAEYARTRGFAVKVFSNGTLVDESTARRLGSLQPVEVGISIYGSDAATHDWFTGVPGSFERSLLALRLLRAQGVTTVVKCLLMKENFTQIEDVKVLAFDAGAIPQFDPIVTPRNDGKRDPLQYELSDTDLYRLFSQEIVSPTEMKGQALLPPESIICRAGRDSFSISPGGQVYPCVALPIPVGNLRQQDLPDIWRSVQATKLRELTLSDLHQCISCADLHYCTRCWGLALVESGDYLGPSYLNCRIARIRHRVSVEHGGSKKEKR